MNKYSKRALKTTATVGMSLAMVLSGVAAPLTNVNVVKAAQCDTTDLKKVEGLFKTAGITADTMKEFNFESKVKVSTVGSPAIPYTVGETVVVKIGDLSVPVSGLEIVASGATDGQINLADVTTTIYTQDFKNTRDGVDLYYGDSSATMNTKADKGNTPIAGKFIVYKIAKTDIEKTPATGGVESKVELFDLIKDTGSWNADLKKVASNCVNDTADIAEYLLKMQPEIVTMFGTNYSGEYGLVGNARDKVRLETITDRELTTLIDFKEKYGTNLTEVQYDLLSRVIYDAEDLLGYDSTQDSYQAQLANFVDSINTRYEKFIDKDEYTSKDLTAGTTTSITKSKITAEINAIKDMTNYTKFKSESSVKDVIEQYEALNEEIATVKETVDSRNNDSYKAYVTGGTKSVKAKYATKGFPTTGDTIVDVMKTADFEIYKAFKTDVLDVVYTLTSKESVSRYLDKSTKSAYATVDQTRAVLNDFNTSLTTIQDIETGEFGWDLLEKHMNKVVSSLDLISKDLEKLDAITLVSGDRAKLIALDDAVYFLKNAGASNLTSAQTRTVRDAERKVTELLETYRVKFGSIDTAVNGWVNKGNGDWTYYENGAAVTKWVAAGTNWFYVKDGVMLRNSWVANNSTGSKWYYVNNEGQMVSNTTVNGYAFDANGVWVK